MVTVLSIRELMFLKDGLFCSATNIDQVKVKRCYDQTRNINEIVSLSNNQVKHVRIKANLTNLILHLHDKTT